MNTDTSIQSLSITCLREEFSSLSTNRFLMKFLLCSLKHEVEYDGECEEDDGKNTCHHQQRSGSLERTLQQDKI